ncbi:hypothetical protein EJ06DRAFT_335003 [Trichodelitschia bisporula]|uniref:sterol 3beta-glucosyltransferase n=1 Tax=Trichodelitschia bisporula TaxID=703511 RepID=A0A6G1I2D0_9PEZI|nr:hypothetical protein EJ06DRAFT_335003 [Trichodelitschia bisporula]
MFGSQDKLRESLGRKLTQQRKTSGSNRASMDLPTHLRDGDDAQEDVTALRSGAAGRYMHQSLFSMITVAGSTADFQSRFDDGNSDSEDDDEHHGPTPRLSKSYAPPPAEPSKPDPSTSPIPIAGSSSTTSGHRRSSSKARLLKSMHKLRLVPIRERKRSSFADDDDDMMSSSMILTPRPEGPPPEVDDKDTPTLSADAPILSRKLQAEAEMQASESSERSSMKDVNVATSRKTSPISLAQRLKDIFGFDEPEEVIAEYPCWLLQSVLLQGFMYVTQKHICFYAYLPKKATTVAKSGYLAKRGHRNPRYNRYFFELKGDVLSYYEDPTKIYYPSGKIDLRLGISATVNDKDKAKDGTYFTLSTDKRDYMFKADTSNSAKEWVKILQKVIFRSHNDGDSVKISLPIDNIMDIEDNPVLDFADTVKIRVIDNDETYAIDEYFFSFFSWGKEAMRVLRIMVEGNTFHKDETQGSEPPSDNEDSGSPGRRGFGGGRPSSVPAHTPQLRDTVRATLTPYSPGDRSHSASRLSNESRRSSLDVRKRSMELSRTSSDYGRRSFSGNRRGDRSPLSPTRQHSNGSPTAASMDHETESSAAIQSLDDTNASASQILNRSDIFQAPTINAPHRTVSDSSADVLKRASQDTARSGNRSKNLPSPYSQRNGLRKPRPGDATPPINLRDRFGDSSQSTGMPTSSAIHNIIHAGTYPLQQTSKFAEFLKSRSKRMSNLLATESMGYYEKVSGMWAGGVKHYGTSQGLTPEDEDPDADDDENAALHAQRFREHFALPDSEQLVASYFGFLHRVLPLYGKIYIGTKHLCYRSLLPGTRTKLILPLKDIESASKEKGYRLGYCGLVVVIRGHEEIFFDFRDVGIRDDCAVTTILGMEAAKKSLAESGLFTEEEIREAETAKAEHQALQEARQDGHALHELALPKTLGEIEPEAPPILFDDPRASIINFKPAEPMRITCLTIGSRGDVQPYIALCKGFIKDGHKAKIATHREFEPWIRKHGIDFAPVGGDPAELMRICVENGMFTLSFLKEASAKFRGWLDELMVSAWEACQNSDLLIESPSAMAGIHIAEALGIPYFRAFTMPWTRTRAYPHAFAVPEYKMGGTYNYMSYVMFDSIFWKAIANQVNRWRKKTLGLGSTGLDKMQPNKVPFLYNFSPHVVVPPLDYSDWIRVTGYWFLDEGEEWTPSVELRDFIARARADGKKLVYVGFGSIVVEDPAALTQTVVESVLKADVRCILSKGWSDRLGKKADATKPEVLLPPEIMSIQSAPHDWLFRHIDAAAHHGGAGTTGASLRAGIPTIAKPFFGDQFFFGQRIEDLGVGICLKKLNTSLFAKALWEATHSERMIAKARVLGEQIRAEDGVGTAIQAIYRDMDYARSLIKKERVGHDEPADDFEETWTFIGDENDADLSLGQSRVEAAVDAGAVFGSGLIARGLV